MKMVITPDEVKNLTGKFIVQVTTDRPDAPINDETWGFWMEKRISFVCGLTWVGFYYQHKSFKNEQDFASYFNDYVDSTTAPEYVEKNKGTRFHRLLTFKELDFVVKKMKERQFEL